jgi:pimeloyl-ACP methyl ester carboxylesterase
VTSSFTPSADQIGSPLAASKRAGPRGSPVIVVGASLFVGFIVAIALALGVVAGSTEPIITGSVLLAFALGWALLAALSVRFTSQPQRWAAVPAVFLGVTGLGLILLAPGVEAMDLLSWVWPPALLVVLAWAVRQFRRDLHGRSRWLLYPVFSVLLLFAVGGAAETILAAVDRGANPMTGQLVDIGGRKMHIECWGSGSPTVVLESGLGEASFYWARIAPAVAVTTRVCAYDRAGYGWSEPPAAPQDGNAVASDLHALLAASGNPGPYVLVGHSTGGPYVRVFAARYPDEVAGMVLLDAQPADAFTALPDFPAFYSSIPTVSALFTPMGRVGLFRLAYASALIDLPPPARDAERAEQSAPRNYAAQRNEFSVLRATLQQALALKTIGDRPLVVLTAASEAQAGWVAAQDEMAGLSTNSSHRVLADETHATLIASERGAAISSLAILDVVAAVRTGAAVALK